MSGTATLTNGIVTLIVGAFLAAGGSAAHFYSNDDRISCDAFVDQLTQMFSHNNLVIRCPGVGTISTFGEISTVAGFGFGVIGIISIVVGSVEKSRIKKKAIAW
jgi:hypothetical protein